MTRAETENARVEIAGRVSLVKDWRSIFADGMEEGWRRKGRLKKEDLVDGVLAAEEYDVGSVLTELQLVR